MHRFILPASAALALALAPAHADTRREGRADLMFGLGSLTSQEATISGPTSLDAGDGVTVDLRFRFHFNPNLAIEVGGTAETENTDLKFGSITTDSVDTDTGFFFVNALFNLTETPISPYVSLGVGSYSHDAGALNVEESGTLFNAAVGVDGRTQGALIWAFEARLLHYEFDDFAENWDRYQFTGLIGFHF